MTKEEMIAKLKRVSEMWKSDSFVYEAETSEESELIKQLRDEGILIWDGGFQWGKDLHNHYKLNN